MSEQEMGYIVWGVIAVVGYLLYLGSEMAKRNDRDHWDDE